MAGIDFQADLNPEQFAAATAPDGPLLVLAAAGTGKTRTLVYRVAYLVECGIPPENVLLLTFTNRAAREMLDRARHLVGPHISGVWGGTFHHMANRMLRRFGRALGFQPDFAILDSDDQETVLAACLRELKLGGKEFPRKEVLLGLFSTATNTGRPLDKIVEDRLAGARASASYEEIERVRQAYIARKLKLGAMDFDDLLVNCARLLEEHPEALYHYRDRFQHILVDEYQDTNTLQARLVDQLASRHRNLLVVGDDFQSIYAWRGANFRNIMDFPKRYADARIYKLETNYRSVPEILAVANVCIAHNPDQFQKTLRATRAAHRKPGIAFLRDGHTQARYVVENLHRLLREGYRASEIAVLYRAHFHAMELQIALAQEHIPHVVTSGVRFFEQAHIKDVCTVIRLLENPGDEMAFKRLLALLPGVGDVTAGRLWKKLDGRCDLALPAHRATLAEGLKPAARALWEPLAPVFAEYAGRHTGRDGAEVLSRFVELFYVQHAVDTFENAPARLDDVQELIVHTAQYEHLGQFLGDMALLTNIDAVAEYKLAQNADAVHLSTVHQAKGLEWRAVIILWAVNGMFPSARSLTDDDTTGGLAEERRLFYVAVTRAKDELLIGVPELRRARDGNVFYVEPSPFVTEIIADAPNLVRQIRRSW